MKLFRSARFFLLACLLTIVPASSFAGVFISIGIAPPPLVVYEQPPCPEDGYLWTPGYWAYGEDGYYWVPGAWVPAPQPGYLWTPPYWGFEGGHYLFHEGYWGEHVGYYGGVNYGFGYMGIGFAGGEWRSGRFAYNTAVMRVDRNIVHNTYINETVVHNTTIINDRHVAYAGGPGGIQHQPSPQERMGMNERHIAPSQIQQQHFQAAARDPQQHFANNHGRPATMAAARPITAPMHTQVQGGNRPGNQPMSNARPDGRAGQPVQQARPEARPSQPGQQARPEARPAQQQARPESRPAQQQARPEARPAQQARPEARPAQQARPEARPAQQARPEARPAQQARPESRPAERPSNEKPERPHGR